jgi:hypothetical protein
MGTCTWETQAFQFKKALELEAATRGEASGQKEK